jgi:hypothetical protein
VLNDGFSCTHFLYADETIFFLKADIKNIDAVLWALYIFEALSDIKINYSKITLIPINLGHAEAHTVLWHLFIINCLNVVLFQI